MPAFYVDVKLYATLRIEADTPEEAFAKAREVKEMTVAGDPFEIEQPGIEVSPVMTCYGPDADAVAQKEG